MVTVVTNPKVGAILRGNKHNSSYWNEHNPYLSWSSPTPRAHTSKSLMTKYPNPTAPTLRFGWETMWLIHVPIAVPYAMCKAASPTKRWNLFPSHKLGPTSWPIAPTEAVVFWFFGAQADLNVSTLLLISLLYCFSVSLWLKLPCWRMIYTRQCQFSPLAAGEALDLWDRPSKIATPPLTTTIPVSPAELSSAQLNPITGHRLVYKSKCLLLHGIELFLVVMQHYNDNRQLTNSTPKKL